ncbi:MAG: efflux RND transporter permease subunit [bacterium]|nr:efflux RND transporter permease subunit [bacterium]
MTLPELAIRRPVTAIMLLVSMVVLGAEALLRLPLAFMPEVEEPRLFVHVPFPNATPEQCERLIVRPLEEALGSVKGIILRRPTAASTPFRCGVDTTHLSYDRNVVRHA